MAKKPGEKSRLFTASLMRWEKKNTRTMPWKGEKDPYKIWLSEIILQQTRVEQGKPYYERFIRQYPTATDLAKADEREVFRLWQGLGYYNRCKNMLAAAKKIMNEHRGRFPDTYEQILDLPGVGEYTAAAIASFAFGLPYAVADGNVQRVLARYFGIEKEINSTAGKKFFRALAQHVLEEKKPAVWNQAIMDFGATVCTPQKPDCGICPLQKDCFAFQHKMISRLPVKITRTKPSNRYFTYILLSWGGKTYIHKRSGGDIWQNLYEFPLVEESGFTEIRQFFKKKVVQSLLKGNSTKNLLPSGTYKQQLTHQTIYARFLHVKISKAFSGGGEKGFFPVAMSDLDQYPFPKIILQYISGIDSLKILK
jgi:A/G-specific adenine glycosylase